MVLNYHGTKYQWRFSKFLTHMLVVVSVLALMISYISNTTKANLPRKEMTIIVREGDTLWSLAERIGPGTDPRLVIRDIKEQNNLHNSNLIAGQKLKLMIGRD
jgi:hypothetical protein